jgi:peptide methionine sulfoxide reductase msrA/msrB
MYRILKPFKLLIVFSLLQSSLSFSSNIENSTNHIKTIVFGAGCFWSVEKKFQETYGVINVESGYADGKNIKPIYKEIIKRENRLNPDNYAEVVKVTYNSNKTNLENLLKTFFEMHDPTQENRQGNDIGVQYRSVVLTSSKEETLLSNKIKNKYQSLLKEKGFGPIKTNIKELTNFYLAENYHQDYLKKNPNGYCPDYSTGVVFSKKLDKFTDNKNLVVGKKILILEAEGCPYCYKLRQDVLNDYQGSFEIFYRKSNELDEIELKSPTWATPTIYFLENGKEVWSHQGYLSNEKFYKSLGRFKLGKTEAYNVAFNQGTDPTYCKEYELFKNTPDGVFIDKLSGAPLFSTKYRFNSKTGWLSFTEAVKDSVTEHMDYSYGMVRVEIRSKSSGIHLGHVFNDGPNGKPRYCINATVLEFVPNLDT